MIKLHEEYITNKRGENLEVVIPLEVSRRICPQCFYYDLDKSEKIREIVSYFNERISQVRNIA